MKVNVKHIAKLGVLAAAVFTVGCAEYEVRKLHKMQATGDAFSQALAGEYKKFATHEIREHFDDTDAEHFAIKGQIAAAGNGASVEPEVLSTRELEATKVPELSKERARLVSALTCKGRSMAPVMAAKAQLHFDEWVEQSEERWQTSHIKDARLDYYENIRQVEEVICPLDTAPQFHVYFGLNSDKLDSKAKDVLAQAAAAAGENCHCQVFLSGYTDASGSRGYNLDLSARRADTVKGELVSKSIADSRIVSRGNGEVPGSAQFDRKNRNVEIIIH